MSQQELPPMESVHIDEHGNIQFFTADGREGIINEAGSTLVRSARLESASSALSTTLELPEVEYVEPSERPRPMTAAEEHAHWNGGQKYDKWTRGEGHVSKDRK
jgi:hypothetical protein